MKRRMESICAGICAVTASLLGTVAGCSDDRPAPTDGPTTTTDASSDAVAARCPDDGGAVDPTSLVDDFEDNNSAMPAVAGRVGSWFAVGDMTTAAIMQPLGDAPPEPIPGGRCGSRHALHVTGSGFLDWGSQIGVALHAGQNATSGTYEEQPYDAAARGYQGISFFARVGETSTITVRFAVSDQYARPEAGLCAINGTTGNSCYDTFGVPLDHELTTEWKEFRVPWTGLSQRSFGLPGGVAPDVSKLYDIAFTFPGGVVFDLWIDDIRFY
jgi:hypothetical protein